jgi:hypothetical protein
MTSAAEEQWHFGGRWYTTTLAGYVAGRPYRVSRCRATAGVCPTQPMRYEELPALRESS